MKDMNRKNIFIAAKNNGHNSMDIYLRVDGFRFYLMNYRHNEPVYRLLKSELRLSDLDREMKRVLATVSDNGSHVSKMDSMRRVRGARNHARKTENSFNHLKEVIREYLEYDLEDDLRQARREAGRPSWQDETDELREEGRSFGEGPEKKNSAA